MEGAMLPRLPDTVEPRSVRKGAPKSSNRIYLPPDLNHEAEKDTAHYPQELIPGFFLPSGDGAYLPSKNVKGK